MSLESNLFVSTPISAFDDNDQYILFRNWLTGLLCKIQSKSYFDQIFCVADLVKDQNSLDDPKKSLISDLAELDNSTCFLLIYPKPTATSALIELGYALAHKKNILLVHPESTDLPFMACQMHKVYENVTKLQVKGFNQVAIDEICKQINEYSLSID